MIQGDPNNKTERKSSTIKIVPKDDEDLSTLNLIQIPHDSTPKQDEKRKSKQLKTNVTEPENKSMKSKAKEENGDSKAFDVPQDSTLTAKLRPNDSGTSRSRSASRFEKTDVKRRSFSTSHIKPERRKQLSLLRRQSVLSNDSTCMTSFD